MTFNRIEKKRATKWKILYLMINTSLYWFWNLFHCFSIEKEQADNAQKLKDSQEACQRVLELQRKLDQAREAVSVGYIKLWFLYVNNQSRIVSKFTCGMFVNYQTELTVVSWVGRRLITITIFLFRWKNCLELNWIKKNNCSRLTYYVNSCRWKEICSTSTDRYRRLITLHKLDLFFVCYFY